MATWHVVIVPSKICTCIKSLKLQRKCSYIFCLKIFFNFKTLYSCSLACCCRHVTYVMQYGLQRATHNTISSTLRLSFLLNKHVRMFLRLTRHVRVLCVGALVKIQYNDNERAEFHVFKKNSFTTCKRSHARILQFAFSSNQQF